MKAILEFNLPEEEQEFTFAKQGHEFLIVIEELDNYLRSKIKYNDLSDTESLIYQEIRSKLWELRRNE